MNSADRLRRLFTYDTWACLRVLAALKESEQFKLRSEAIKMFAHIVSSQRHWYGRIMDEAVTDTALWPADDLEECQKQLAFMKDKWSTLINENEEQLDRFVDYQNSKGTAYRTMLSDILHHVIIHGQHHRAQIATMLRRSDIVPPPTDFIFYLRETKA